MGFCCFNRCSIYTFLLYLNDEDSVGAPCVGGATNFLEEEEEEKEEKEGNEGLIAKSQRQKRVICSVKPKAGSALLFLHNMLHEGARLEGGVKYVLRTEVMFRRVETPLRSPVDAESLAVISAENDQLYDLYRRSEEFFE